MMVNPDCMTTIDNEISLRFCLYRYRLSQERKIKIEE